MNSTPSLVSSSIACLATVTPLVCCATTMDARQVSPPPLDSSSCLQTTQDMGEARNLYVTLCGVLSSRVGDEWLFMAISMNRALVIH